MTDEVPKSWGRYYKAAANLEFKNVVVLDCETLIKDVISSATTLKRLNTELESVKR